MNPQTLAYLAEASRLVQLGLEVFNLAAAAFSRMKQINASEITDADLAALQAERRAALERLANLAG